MKMNTYHDEEMQQITTLQKKLHLNRNKITNLRQKMKYRKEEMDIIRIELERTRKLEETKDFIHDLTRADRAMLKHHHSAYERLKVQVAELESKIIHDDFIYDEMMSARADR